MHIRESDTPFEDPDREEELIAVADEFLTSFHKKPDLELLAHNAAAVTTTGHRCFLEGLQA